MRIHTDPVSRTERIASIALATGVTVASAVLVLASARPRFVPVWAPVATRHAEPLAEQLAYLVTTPAPTVAPARSAESRHAVTSRTRERAPKPHADVDSASGAEIPRLTTPTQPAIADTGAPWPAPAMSPLLWPDTEPIRFDSARRALHGNLADTLAAGQHENPSLTQTDRDAQLRAAALATIAARGAGLHIARLRISRS